MATKYDVIQRPGVQLKYDDPMSGWEALSSALGGYADPQYQLQLKRDRREDARVHLAGKRFDELQEQNDLAEARQKKNDRINAENAKRQGITFQQAQEDREFNIEKENYDITINELSDVGDFEGLNEYLDTFTTSNPRLSAIAKNRGRLLSRRSSQLDSAVEDLLTLAPGLMEKYADTNALKALLFKNPNAIANQIMLGEIGEITQGKEKEYEARKSILAAQIEQLKLTLPGSQARIDLTSAMNSTIEGIRKYGGFDVPAGVGGDPLGNIEDQLTPDEYKQAGFDFGTLFSEEASKKEKKAEKIREKHAPYFVSKLTNRLDKLAKLKQSPEGMWGKKKSKKRNINKLEDEIGAYIKNVYSPTYGFKDPKFRTAFKNKYKGEKYDEMIKYFNTFFPEYIKERKMLKEFGAYNPEAVTGFSKMMEELSPQDTIPGNIPEAWLETTD